MDVVLGEIVDAFESGLGPFADAAVVELARRLNGPSGAPAARLRVLMQGHRRAGVRSRAALITVVGEELRIEEPGGAREAWPLAECAVVAERVRMAGMRLTIRTGSRSIALLRAMPIDEAVRLVWAASEDAVPDGVGAYSTRPPVARLGASATLYEDRVSFAEGPTRMLVPEVRARALELPGRGEALRSVSRLMQGAQGRPRHVLVDGPGWTQVAAAPETRPALADEFAEAINRRAANSG